MNHLCLLINLIDPTPSCPSKSTLSVSFSYSTYSHPWNYVRLNIGNSQPYRVHFEAVAMATMFVHFSHLPVIMILNIGQQ